jgi:hypothetical protein
LQKPKPKLGFFFGFFLVHHSTTIDVKSSSMVVAELELGLESFLDLNPSSMMVVEPELGLKSFLDPSPSLSSFLELNPN